MSACAQDAEPAKSGSPTGTASPVPVPEGCLILKINGRASPAALAAMVEMVKPVAQRLNLEPMVVDEDVDVQMHYKQESLIAALHEQTAALNRLASSNEALVQAMSEGEDDPDAEPRTYLDGSSVR